MAAQTRSWQTIVHSFTFVLLTSTFPSPGLRVLPMRMKRWFVTFWLAVELNLRSYIDHAWWQCWTRLPTRSRCGRWSWHPVSKKNHFLLAFTDTALDSLFVRATKLVSALADLSLQCTYFLISRHWSRNRGTWSSLNDITAAASYRLRSTSHPYSCVNTRKVIGFVLLRGSIYFLMLCNLLD